MPSDGSLAEALVKAHEDIRKQPGFSLRSSSGPRIAAVSKLGPLLLLLLPMPLLEQGVFGVLAGGDVVFVKHCRRCRLLSVLIPGQIFPRLSSPTTVPTTAPLVTGTGNKLATSIPWV